MRLVHLRQNGADGHDELVVWLADNEDQEFPARARFATSPAIGSKQQFQALATHYDKRGVYTWAPSMPPQSGSGHATHHGLQNRP